MWDIQEEEEKKTNAVEHDVCRTMFPQLNDESWWTNLALLIEVLHFIVYRLFNDDACSSAWKDLWIMNWKGSGRKQSWPNLRYYPGICLEELRKITRTWVRIVGVTADIVTGHILNISQKNRFLSQLVRFDVCEHQNKLNVLLRGETPSYARPTQRYTCKTDCSDSQNKLRKITSYILLLYGEYKWIMVQRSTATSL